MGENSQSTLFPSKELVDLTDRISKLTQTPTEDAQVLLNLGIDAKKFDKYYKACQAYKITPIGVADLAKAGIPPELAWSLGEALAKQKRRTGTKNQSEEKPKVTRTKMGDRIVAISGADKAVAAWEDRLDPQEAVAAWENFKSRLGKITRSGWVWRGIEEKVSQDVAVRAAILGLAPEKVDGVIVTWLEAYPNIKAGQLSDVLAGYAPVLDKRKETSRDWNTPWGELPIQVQLKSPNYTQEGKFLPAKPALLSAKRGDVAARVAKWARLLPGVDIVSICFLHSLNSSEEIIESVLREMPELSFIELAVIAAAIKKHGGAFYTMDAHGEVQGNGLAVGGWLAALRRNNADFGAAMVLGLLENNSKSKRKNSRPESGKLGILARRSLPKAGHLTGSTTWCSIEMETYFRLCGAVDPSEVTKVSIPSYSKVGKIFQKETQGAAGAGPGAKERMKAVREEYGRLVGDYNTYFNMPAFLASEFKPSSDLLALLVAHQDLVAKGVSETELSESASKCEEQLTLAVAEAKNLGFGYVAGVEVDAVVMKTLTSAKESMQLAHRSATEGERKSALDAVSRKLDKAGELLGGPPEFAKRGMLEGRKAITSGGMGF